MADGSTWDLLGVGIDLDRDYLAVGAWHESNPSGPQSGASYLFQRNLNGDDRWGLLQRFVADDGMTNSAFGWKITVSGSTIAVGASGDGVVADGAGAAYVFEVIDPE